MRKPMLSVGAAFVAAFVAGGAVCGALLANAQPVSSPPSVLLERSPGGPMHGMGHPGPEPGTFALVYRQSDRQLSPADVGKIAEAFLLWEGNHTWKIVDLAATPQGPVAFGVATPEGSVIARFTMDPRSGRVTRTS